MRQKVPEFLALILIVGGCEQAKQPAEPKVQANSEAEYIGASAELSSWGTPYIRWDVDRTGRVQIVRTPFMRSPRSETIVVFDLSTEEQKRFFELLKPLAAYVGRTVDCGQIGTDPPHVLVRLHRSTTSEAVAFPGGCVSEEAARSGV